MGIAAYAWLYHSLRGDKVYIWQAVFRRKLNSKGVSLDFFGIETVTNYAHSVIAALSSMSYYIL